MFAEYNYENFPLVYVKLNNIDCEEDFDKFLNELEKIIDNTQIKYEIFLNK